jgi:alpha-N-arabinofuranosidase
LNPNEPAALECDLKNYKAKEVTGRILTADAMNAHNTFEQPDAVKPAEFSEVEINDGKISAAIPSKSVVVLTVE